MQVSLTLDQWQYIGAVLSEQPYKHVAGLIGTIESQLNEGVKKADQHTPETEHERLRNEAVRRAEGLGNESETAPRPTEDVRGPIADAIINFIYGYDPTHCDVPTDAECREFFQKLKAIEADVL